MKKRTWITMAALAVLLAAVFTVLQFFSFKNTRLEATTFLSYDGVDEVAACDIVETTLDGSVPDKILFSFYARSTDREFLHLVALRWHDRTQAGQPDKIILSVLPDGRYPILRRASEADPISIIAFADPALAQPIWEKGREFWRAKKRNDNAAVQAILPFVHDLRGKKFPDSWFSH